MRNFYIKFIKIIIDENQSQVPFPTLLEINIFYNRKMKKVLLYLNIIP